MAQVRVFRRINEKSFLIYLLQIPRLPRPGQPYKMLKMNSEHSVKRRNPHRRISHVYSTPNGTDPKVNGRS